MKIPERMTKHIGQKIMFGFNQIGEIVGVGYLNPKLDNNPSAYPVYIVRVNEFFDYKDSRFDVLVISEAGALQII